MSYPASELVIDPVLIRKYDVHGPCYTSYPTADRFVEAFGEADCRHWLATRNIGGINQPLSVYVHLPSSDTARTHRAFDKTVTRDHGRSTEVYQAPHAGIRASLAGCSARNDGSARCIGAVVHQRPSRPTRHGRSPVR